MLISIIIPTLNESGTLERTISCAQRGTEVEIIVVDGGSHDRTPELAQSLGARTLTSPPDRARQMNQGASAAGGKVLLFLHADTWLPEGFDQKIRRTVKLPGIVAGAFRLHIDAPHLRLRVIEKLANWRSRRLQFPYGDQAIFLKTELFDEVGRYPEWPIMEDYELVRRLKRRGKIALSDSSVSTSARRWLEEGVAKTTLLNQVIILGFHLGIPPARLARWYGRNSHPA